MPPIILNGAAFTAVRRDIVPRSEDPYVKAIIHIADSAHIPLKAIFFIEEIYKQKITLARR